MAIIMKANKVNLFVSSVMCVFWDHSPNVLDTLHICNISWLRVNPLSPNDLQRRREVSPLKIKIPNKKSRQAACAEGFNFGVKRTELADLSNDAFFAKTFS
jgi:hypothetical protein